MDYGLAKLSLDLTVDELKDLVKMREIDPDSKIQMLEESGPRTRAKEFGLGFGGGAAKGSIGGLVGTALVGGFRHPGWWKTPLVTGLVGGGLEGAMRASKDPKYEWLKARAEYKSVKKMLEEEKTKAEVSDALPQG